MTERTNNPPADRGHLITTAGLERLTPPETSHTSPVSPFHSCPPSDPGHRQIFTTSAN